MVIVNCEQCCYSIPQSIVLVHFNTIVILYANEYKPNTVYSCCIATELLLKLNIELCNIL